MKRSVYLGALALLLGVVAVAVIGGAEVRPVRLDETQTPLQPGGLAPPSLVLSDGGIAFPDETIQTTAGPQYLGEFCWLFTDDPGNPGASSSFVRLGLTHYGDGHVSVNGLGFDDDGPLRIPVTGTYEVIGDERLMTLTITNFESVPPDGGEFASVFVQVQLDHPSGDGTFQAITILYSLDGEAFNPLVFEQGSALFLPNCVIP